MPDNRSRNLHVAVIMDGNGRWAAARGLPRVAGHRAGLSSAHAVVEQADALGVRCLTLYAFSSDNWKRPAAEVQRIFWLLRAFLRLETERLKARGARLQVIGRRDRLAPAVLDAIEKAEGATARGRGLRLRVAIDYSSRSAIAGAARNAMASDGNTALSAEHVGNLLTEALTAESGEVDLLIRTGGEKRLSDFLLWECAYAELLFDEKMWPEFGAADLETALREFSRRQRRFGGLNEPCISSAPGL